jgi:3-hydroxyisobutyrate dehydrogenase-like beta-hydroxyacid dehydrogenase
MTTTIGFVGLGAMGLPMSRRLADAGFPLVVHDPDRAAIDALLGQGQVEAASDVRAAVAASDVLITCLPSPQAVEEVYTQVDKAGLIACDCSTVGPSLAIQLHEELGARGVRYVECPMLGGATEAASGQLFLILSGDRAAIDQLSTILEVLGRARRYVGGPGQASRMKVVQNGLGLVQVVAIAEALAVLAKAGADLESWCDVVVEGQGMADTPLFRAKAKAMLEPEPPLKGTLRIGAKDIDLACALANEVGVLATLFEDARRVLQEAMALGLGEADLATVARAVERRAGVSLTRS